MSIKNNVTFRRKHRPVWYGMLCLVLITAAVSTMSLIPMQSSDLSSAESEGSYTLNGGEYTDVTENNFGDILNLINNSQEGSVFTITVNSDDTNFSGIKLELGKGKEVTLISSGKAFTLTITTEEKRHFTVVSGTLILENIILGGKEIGGGIEVQTSGELIMNDGAVIQNCKAYDGDGGGVFNGGTFTMNDGAVIQDCFGERGGGVYITRGEFTMNDGAVIQNCKAYDGDGGGVFIAWGEFTMNDGAVIQNCKAYDGDGGGVYNGGTFTMNDGEISGNTALGGNGGGVYIGYVSTFTMKGGEISGNTAELGGGVHIFDEIYDFIMEGGKISGNTATGVGSKGSGGGIYAERYSDLTVNAGVIFSGNTAPTLRTEKIDDDAVLTHYIKKISDKVVLSAPASYPENKNAPAFNNFDINYPGDTYVVSMKVTPNGGGTVAMKYEGNGTVDENGFVYVPISYQDGGEVTLSATPESGYEFIQFKIGEEKFSENLIVFEVKGSVTVFAEFLLIQTQPEQTQPEHKDYYIKATADSGSAIGPSETVKVPYGESKTFTFSAMPGYKITAVKVNGDPISSAELASGEYTFRNVKSNHTIEVVSGADDGSGGGSDVGAGGSGGSETGSGGNADSEWLIIGVVCVMLAVFSGAVALIVRRDRRRTGSGPEQP